MTIKPLTDSGAAGSEVSDRRLLLIECSIPRFRQLDGGDFSTNIHQC
jgi:hypothetical protein